MTQLSHLAKIGSNETTVSFSPASQITQLSHLAQLAQYYRFNKQQLPSYIEHMVELRLQRVMVHYINVGM